VNIPPTEIEWLLLSSGARHDSRVLTCGLRSSTFFFFLEGFKVEIYVYILYILWMHCLEPRPPLLETFVIHILIQLIHCNCLLSFN